MKLEKLNHMTRGWVAGDFEPAVLRTKAAEFAVQHYPAGAAEAWHYHKVATEITVIVLGEAEMNGRRLCAGDIVMLEPGEGADFRCLTDVTTAVLKLPSVIGDKYTR
jgi:hypothetical protein